MILSCLQCEDDNAYALAQDTFSFVVAVKRVMVHRASSSGQLQHTGTQSRTPQSRRTSTQRILIRTINILRFEISEQLILEQSDEIFGVSQINWESSPWKQLSLINDEEVIFSCMQRFMYSQIM